MGFLSSYQQELFNSFRSQVRDEEIELITVVSSGSGNSYGEGVVETEETETLDCKIGWGPVFKKSETPGGYEEIGDARIIIYYDDTSKVEAGNVFFRASGGDLAIIEVNPAELSGETLVICKRR
jgi:hypothetical protein